MQPLISVIIPIYQVEQYLEECVDSMLAQQYRNLEIILVDDGSADRCPEICDRYAQADERIRVVHKTNGGLSDARNAGLDVATGKYVFFLDGDDRADDRLFSTCVDLMENGQLDLLVFGYNEIDDGDYIFAKPFQDITLQDAKARFDFTTNVYLQYGIAFGVWNKMFRREIIEAKRLRFVDNQKIFAEDIYFVSCYLLYVQKLEMISDVFYYYRIRNHSIMQNNRTIIKLNQFTELGKAVYAHMEKAAEGQYAAEHFSEYVYVLMHNQYAAGNFGEICEAVRRIYDMDTYQKWNGQILRHFIKYAAKYSSFTGLKKLLLNLRIVLKFHK